MLKRRAILLGAFMAFVFSATAQTDYEKYIDAANNGDAEAQYQIGMCYREGKGIKKDYKKSLQWLNKAADQGHANAILQVGVCYYKGWGVAKDKKKSSIYYENAAEKGVAKAQYAIGIDYYDGNGVKKDINKAIYWVEKSAEQGDINAIRFLGLGFGGAVYSIGINYERSTYYLLKGAELGYSDCQFNVAQRYRNGEGVKQNYEKAAYWFKKASENGNPYALSEYEKTLLLIQPSNLLSQDTSNNQLSNQNIVTNTKELQPKGKKPSSPVDLNIPTTDKENSNTFAIVIGNERYKNVAEVPFAVNDAKIFSEYLEKTLGVPHEQIKLIENAGFNDIRIAVNWLNQAMAVCEGKGKAIVYYAGHGIPNESDNSSYLLPVDGIGNDPSSAYSLKDFYDKLSKMQAQSVTVFLDACFSGTKRENGMLVAARGVAIKVKPSAPKGKMVVFSAAQGDETAYPYQDMQHGLFTYFLLKKLQETKGNVTLGELGDYLKSEVKRQSFLKNNKVQTPMISVATPLQNQWKTIKMK